MKTNAKYHLLVVDDEPINLRLTKEILNDEYNLSFATSGQQALEAAKKIRPDLVLLDIMMPEINGYETCRMLKAEPSTQHIPVIFCTTLHDDDDESQGFLAGGVDFLTKPVKPSILEARVRNYLQLNTIEKEFALQNSLLERYKTLNARLQELEAINSDALFQKIIDSSEWIFENCNLSEPCRETVNQTAEAGRKINIHVAAVLKCFRDLTAG